MIVAPFEFKIIGRPVASGNFRTGRKSGPVGRMSCPVAGSSADWLGRLKAQPGRISPCRTARYRGRCCKGVASAH